VHRKAHASDKGSITGSHTKPSDGISTDQLEVTYLGRLPTTKGLPIHKNYKIVTYGWIITLIIYSLHSMKQKKVRTWLNPKKSSKILQLGIMYKKDLFKLKMAHMHLLFSKHHVMQISKSSHFVL
jgi:hypothetical protein